MANRMASGSTVSIHPALASLLPPHLSTHHVAIRVRTDKKMNHLITKSLSSLRDEPDLPIILHCFPTFDPASLSSPPPPAAIRTRTNRPVHPSPKNSVESIPKLVSVAEVVKREYGKFVSVSTERFTTPSSKGEEAKAPLVEEFTGDRANVEESRGGGVNHILRREGLHQYSTLTTFESIGFDSEMSTQDSNRKAGEGSQEKDRRQEQLEWERQELIKMAWLTGKAGKDQKPKAKHTPCLVIVLSTKKIRELETQHFPQYTYQSPLPLPKLPKPESKRTAAAVCQDTPEHIATKPKKRRRRGGSGKKEKTTTGTVTGEKENESDQTNMAVDEPPALTEGSKGQERR